MRCIVIGATGHIGSWLVPMLVEANHEVLAISRARRQPYHTHPAWSMIRHLELDRADPAFAQRVAQLRPDVVVDLICFDVESAATLVEALDGVVGVFLHCGTLWVHGRPLRVPYDETAAREPFGEYGIRKAAIEQYLLARAQHGFPATVLHPGHITGPGWLPINPAGNLNPEVFERLASGRPVLLPDDGSARLQHVHAADVARAFALAIAQPDRAIGEAFHIAAREPVTLRVYAEAVAGWYGRTATLEFLPLREWEQQASAEDARLTRDHVLHSPAASIAKAEQRLGFAPQYSALEAVRSTLFADQPLRGANL